MAKLIQPTPTLEGKDAENFYRELERVKSKEEIERTQRKFEEADKIFRTFGKHLVMKMIE